MRGFRRVDPSQPASKNTGKNETAANPSKEEEARRLRAPGGSHPTTGTPPTPPTIRNPPTMAPPADGSRGDNDNDDSVYKGKYCHFFVNQGNCTYSERTGYKCRYEHKKAPMCNFGTSCSRTKCMYSHPKIPGTQTAQTAQTAPHFLGQMMSPWNMVNPWINQGQTHWNIPSPWIQANQNQRH